MVRQLAAQLVDLPNRGTVPWVVLGTGATAALACFMVWAPWLAGFGVAVTSAVGWCLWLERRPSGMPMRRLPRSHRGLDRP